MSGALKCSRSLGVNISHDFNEFGMLFNKYNFILTIWKTILENKIKLILQGPNYSSVCMYKNGRCFMSSTCCDEA